MAPSEKLMKVRVALAGVGIGVGVSAALVFAVKYQSWNIVIWAFASAVFAAIAMSVHIQYMKGKWKGPSPVFKRYMLTGCFAQLAGVCGIVAYISVAATEKQDLLPDVGGPGYYLTSIWCFMTLKWGFFLFYYSRQYRDLLSDAYDSLN